MLQRFAWFSAALSCAALTLAACADQATAADTGSKLTPGSDARVVELHALYDAEWQRGLRENPENASQLGDKRYNDRWGDRSIQAIQQSHDADVAALQKLKQIDPGGLSQTEALNYTLFEQQLEDNINSYRFRPYLMPVDHIYGLQSTQDITQVLSFDTEKDYADWTARLRAFGTLTDQTIALMQQGVAEQRVPACAILNKIPDQIAKQIVTQPQDSAFYTPFKQFPKTIAAEIQTKLAGDGANAVQQSVVPAFKRFQTFFKNDYLPHCRSQVGVSALPDGAAYYTYLAKHHTTTELTPEQIHQLGLSEVARIRTAMDALRTEVGFKGSFADFSKFLRTDKRFYFSNGDALLTAYGALGKRIDGELPHLFGKLPRLPYGVRAVPMETAPYQTTAYYQPGAADGTRAGYFYANLYKPETRPKWEMEVLTSHEAVPGHHLQIALQQELEGLPEFRTNGLSYTAFVEGWALYSESLGYELGLYKDPYSRYGQLTYEMWRACRLVMDTGMHAKGWTRSQAIDFMLANTPRAQNDIEVEVDRYIAWPGQALAYKIGQLKIRELRSRAEHALGDKFDLRAFHDMVLGSGALPLEVLERNVDAWIAQRKNN
ncbi:MAG: hypothetical protein JWR16_1163 [Nevskia sp.]|nr:hypothetical protein [Nevskia sp.]